MYPTDLKHGPLKLPFVKNLDHNIMLKTIQNLYYNKSTPNFNMTSPFLVDNILHQQKNVNFHNQYINQQIENYVLQRQNYTSRENSPETEEKMADNEEEQRNEEVEEPKIENDDDSKSNEEFNNVKKESYYGNDYYRNVEDNRQDKEVLNIPSLNRCQTCGAFDCPPFACKKSGIRRLEELEKRFNLTYQENSGDEDIREGKTYTEDIVRNCEEYNNEPKKPLLKFSVSAILGDREEKSSNVNGKYYGEFYLTTLCTDSYVCC